MAPWIALLLHTSLFRVLDNTEKLAGSVSKPSATYLLIVVSNFAPTGGAARIGFPPSRQRFSEGSCLVFVSS
jgi:hypothetical protein